MSASIRSPRVPSGSTVVDHEGTRVQITCGIDWAEQHHDGRALFGTPKSHQRRSVPLPRFLVTPMAARLVGRNRDELVFTSPGGAVLRNNNFRRRVFDRAAESVGLTGLTPHDLRHTAASLAVAEGANVKAVQRVLGHASAAMTLDVYADLFEDDLDDVADRLDRAAAHAGADSMRTDGVVPAFDEIRPNRGHHG
jgi:integrase